MTWLIWGGAATTLVGVIGLLWCIRVVMGNRRKNLDENAMRAALQKVVALNMGALAISAIGLMMVVVGIILG